MMLYNTYADVCVYAIICAYMCVQILSQMNRWENFSPILYYVPPFLIISFALKKF